MSNIKKKIILLSLLFIFAVILCGSVSAASNAYNTSQESVQQAISDDDLGFEDADSTLAITTAGSAQNNGQSTEDGLQGITDATSSLPDNQKISQGEGNLVVLNHPNDPLEYTYVTKKDSILNAKTYTVTSAGIIAGKTAYISSDMSQEQFEEAKIALGSNALEIMSIAQAWSNGATYDLLKIAASSGGISQGSISGYVMSKSFAQNYPLENSQQSYHVIVTPGNGDDNAPMALLDVAPLKWVKSGSNTYYSYYAMNSGNPDENAYIKWDRSSNTGILVLWKQNGDLKSQFTAETGIILNNELSELQFNNWLLNKLKTGPSSLILIENMVQIDKSNFDYLWAKGIDKAYINSLKPLNQQYTFENILPVNDYNNMFAKGQEAAQIAQSLLGFGKGDSNIAVITSAGYSLIDGKSTLGVLDGLADYMRIQLKNLMSLQVGNWVPLWFAFIKKEANDQLNAVLITDVNGNLITSSWNGKYVFDISAEALKDNNYAKNSVYNFLGGGKSDTGYYQQDYFIVGLANAWALGMPYEFQKATLEGFFPCSGLCQRILTAMYILGNYKLGPNKKYILISPAAHHDIPFMDLLGVSPSEGTYYTQGVSNSASDPNAAVILIIWNSSTKTGKAVLLDLNQNAINAMQDEDLGVNKYYYKTMYWALWYLDKAFPGGSRADEVNAAFNVVKEVQITEKDLQILTGRSVDPITYLKSISSSISEPLNPISPIMPSNEGITHKVLPYGSNVNTFLSGLLSSSRSLETLVIDKTITQNPVSPIKIVSTYGNQPITENELTFNSLVWYIIGLAILLISFLVYIRGNIQEFMVKLLKGPGK